jgi:4-amino-4-deoxy-L-arabinose transferase-like glycosyltransferase
MSNAPSVSAANDLKPRRPPFFLAGVLLFVLGPPVYVVQFQSKLLFAPWYVPIMASIGVGLMVAAVWSRRGMARTIGAVLFGLVCGLEWFMLGVGTATPLYSGPAEAGRTVPEFSATRADGKPFTETDLKRGNPTVVLFFRGRW